MAIYTFNMLVGYFPTGVDYAQGYRAKVLEECHQPVKFIFTELPGKRDIVLYERAGIHAGQMLSMHLFFAGNQSMEVSTNKEDKLTELKDVLRYTGVERLDTEIRLLRDGRMIATMLLEEQTDRFYAIHYYSRETRLIRTEFYTDRISYANYYMTAKGNGGRLYAKLVRREFYNVDGSVAYEQIWEEEKEWYLFPDGKRYTKSQFVAEFIKMLNLSERDTVFVDRGGQLDFLQPLFQFGGRARFVGFFHSDLYFDKGEDPWFHLYLNYEYFYWSKYSERFDTMIVSTQEQKERLIEKFREYNCSVPDIEVIPVSGLSQLRYPQEGRKPYSLVSVSRINPRKKIEWIIKSVVKAHQKNPNIFIDIYGEGDDDCCKNLQNIVTANDAHSYIHFKGHVDVTEVYREYEVYVSASLWETLGLTLMEAVGSGLAMIGLDVKYGNRLFIKNEKNGYLIPYDRKYIEDDDSELIDAMADKIVEIFQNQERLERFHQASYEIAEGFSDEIIGEKWRKLFA